MSDDETPPPPPVPGAGPPPPPVSPAPPTEPALPKTSYSEPPPEPVDEEKEDDGDDDLEPVAAKQDNKILLLLVHFVGLFGIPFYFIGNWLLPLLLWVTKRNDTKGMEREGRAAVNFQVAIAIALLIITILGKLPFGKFASSMAAFIFALIVIANIAMSLWAVAMVNIGKPAPYPKIYDFLGKFVGPAEREEDAPDNGAPSA
jgi:uncharacterized Tic20 family protein